MAGTAAARRTVDGSADGEVLPSAEGTPGDGMMGRVRSGALWSGASSLVLKFANIALMAVVVRLVSPREFGIFAVALTVYAIVAGMSELGVASALQRGDTDAERLAPTVATVSLVAAAVMAGGTCLLAEPLAAALGAPEAAPAVRVMSLAVLMVGVFAVPGAMLARDFRQDRIFLANLVSFVPSSALLLGLATLGDGALAFAWSRVLGQVVAGGVMTWSAGKWYGFGLDRRALVFALGVGLPLAGANLVGYSLLNVDYAFIGRMLGPVVLGTYVLAFNVANWSSSLLKSMINGVAVPMFSRLRQDTAALGLALARAHRAVALVSWPVGALTVASAVPLVETLYGQRWVGAAPILQVLAPYGVLAIHALLYSNVLVGGSGHARALLYVQILWFVVLVPAMILGVRAHGALGAAWAHVVVVVVAVVPCYLVAARRMNGVRAHVVVRAIAPIAGAALAAGVADFLVTRAFTVPVLQLLAGLLAGGLVFVVLAARPALQVLEADGQGRLARLMAPALRVAQFADVPRLAFVRLLGRREIEAP